MNVILTEDVEKLGGPNEVVDVADGYARNFLLPRGLAMPATKSAMANLDSMKRVAERRIVRRRGAAEELAKAFAGKTLQIEARVGTAGRLYGSVGTADIASQVHSDLGIEIERKQVMLDEPIRSSGLYTVTIALHRDVNVELPVQVGDPEAAPVEEVVAG